MIDFIISNEYVKVYRTYCPIKNFDIAQDRFLTYIMLLLIHH